MSAGCALCGGAGEVLAELPTSITSESKPLSGASRLSLCSRCGHLFTEAQVDWHTYYSQSYDATLTDDGLDELVVLPDGKTTFRTDFDYGLFRSMTKEALHGAARVLEFGCGRGRILSRLTRDGFRRVWAYDVSERYRENAARLLGPGRVSIGALPEGQYDVIATFFVLEHDTDPVGSLRQLRARIADDGTLFVMVPNWRTNLGDLACADHVHHFSVETLTVMLAATGFGVSAVDASAAGTLAVVAKPCEPRKAFDDPERVKAARAATRPFIETLARLSELPSKLDGRRVFLYGAGFYAALAHAFVPNVSGVYNSNPRKHGLERFGHTVAAPSVICAERHASDALLVCVNARSAKPIADQYRAAFGEVLTLG
ncbi:MAG: class I SAM-dependent methyltransferase [Archangiaceae bacterium]|nr:class I SAM-dependent methyltransferase [Archangiaceae bacterium]